MVERRKKKEGEGEKEEEEGERKRRQQEKEVVGEPGPAAVSSHLMHLHR